MMKNNQSLLSRSSQWAARKNKKQKSNPNMNYSIKYVHVQNIYIQLNNGRGQTDWRSGPLQLSHSHERERETVVDCVEATDGSRCVAKEDDDRYITQITQSDSWQRDTKWRKRKKEKWPSVGSCHRKWGQQGQNSSLTWNRIESIIYC